MKYECEDCGHRWELNEDSFLLEPFCPNCGSDFILDEEELENIDR